MSPPAAVIWALNHQSPRILKPIRPQGGLVRTVRCAGKEIALTAREWVLFEAFLGRPNQLMSRAQLEEHLWSFDGGAESNAIEVYVSRLRRKLDYRVIETVRGLGYKLGTP